MKTILITGASSGFGLETAKYFLAKGWKVIATMRNPADNSLPESGQLSILPLDVTNMESIKSLVYSVDYIDVLVNNAGVGMLAALEGTSDEVIQTLFTTNTLGYINMVKAFLPQFRQQKSGVIINVSSAVTLKALPLLSVYTASKAAINAFTESLAIELEPFNIRMNLVIPGQAPATRFGANAKARMENAFPEPYLDLANKMFLNRPKQAKVTRSQDVAEAIWQAATDDKSPMWIVAGEDAKAMVLSD